MDETYLGEQAPEGTQAAQKIATLEQQVQQTIKQTPTIARLTKEIQIEKGKRVYLQNCAMCHQPDGNGLPQVFPPLAHSDYLMADKARRLSWCSRAVGTGHRNGHMYNGVMPPQVLLNNEQVADVLTFVVTVGAIRGGRAVEEVRVLREERN